MRYLPIPSQAPIGGHRQARAFLTGLLLILVLLPACTPRLAPGGPGLNGAQVNAERLNGEAFLTDDGLELPYRVWRPEGAPKAIVLALHGFNDYSNAFEGPGAFFADRKIVTYAYDQRGFGESPNRGLWAGTDRLTADATAFARALRRAHPGLPLYLLGESMGGAVVIATVTGQDPPAADGVVLSAPAVWARATMPWYQRTALWLSAHTLPWAHVTGRGLDIQASDNIEMLRGLGRDPLFIKETRVDAVYGLVDLMDLALVSAPELRSEALLLYGQKDEVVPLDPTFRLWQGLPEANGVQQRPALYQNGWHMLLRDLQAEVVLADIVAWIGDRHTPLPSGADRHAAAALRNFENTEEAAVPVGAD